MKRVVFFVFAMVLIASSAAQSAATDAQRIVGSWTIIEGGGGPGHWQNGNVWVFNANGTVTRGGRVFNFGISVDGYIAIVGDQLSRLFMSPDGSRMILSGVVVFQRN